MAKTYQVTSQVRIINRIVHLFIRLGVAPKRMVLLTVKGRKSSKPYTTPVSLVLVGERRWLVSPYGEVSWVKNARAIGEVILTRGLRSETRKIVELDPAKSAPILKQYLENEPITQPYFDAQPHSAIDQFEAESGRHPVFELR